MKNIKNANVIKDISMRYFKHFKVFEFFPNCTPEEVNYCVSSGLFDSALVLLGVLDEFREFLGKPIRINSGFRDFKHNARVGGSPTSQHTSAEAIDFTSYFVENNNVLVDKFKEFLSFSACQRFVGQVILYDTFIHFALSTARYPKLCYYDKRKGKNNH